MFEFSIISNKSLREPNILHQQLIIPSHLDTDFCNFSNIQMSTELSFTPHIFQISLIKEFNNVNGYVPVSESQAGEEIANMKDLEI